MDNLQLQPDDLPAFLDPLFDYLADRLPASLYDAAFTALSYAILLISAAVKFIASLPSWKPWEWDSQKILPPLISILVAYYAILSVYRTTGWMVRMTFRFMQLSLVLGLLGAGAGLYLGTNGGQGGLFGTLRDVFSRDERDIRGGGRRHERGRPRAWESFDAHDRWRYEDGEQQDGEEGMMSEIERFMRGAVGAAGRAFGGGVYEVAAAAAHIFQGVADSAPDNAADDEQRTTGRRRQPSRRAKTAARRRQRSR